MSPEFLKQDGKTRTVYVPKDLTEEVRASIREHRRIRKLLREITHLELARIRMYSTGVCPCGPHVRRTTG